MNKSLGTHIILDMYQCNFEWLDNMTNKEIVGFFSLIVKKNNLAQVGEISYFFKHNSFSIIIALKESHFAIHTWPEKGYVSADVFVCNYTEDNTLKAKKLSEEICNLFNSKTIKKQVIER